MSQPVSKPKKVIGLISALTGWAGCIGIASLLPEPWAAIVGWSLAFCVVAAHNWIATEKL